MTPWEPLNLFFSPSIDHYFPLFNRAPRVVMIHNVMPGTIGETMLPGRASRARRQAKVRTALAQADLVATGSRDVGGPVCRVLNVDPGQAGGNSL
jgi:hypothetical protein